jgi:hypothetical protein
MTRWVPVLPLLLGLLIAVTISLAATSTVVFAVDGMT